MTKNVKELKEFRRRERISQRELAKLTKISRGTIAAWERTGRITTDGLKRLNTKIFPPSYGESKKQGTKKGITRIMVWIERFLFLKSRRVAGHNPTYSKKGK